MIYCPKDLVEYQKPEFKEYAKFPKISIEWAAMLVYNSHKWAIQNIVKASPLAFGWFTNDWNIFGFETTSEAMGYRNYKRVAKSSENRNAPGSFPLFEFIPVIPVIDTDNAEIHLIGFSGATATLVVYDPKKVEPDLPF